VDVRDRLRPDRGPLHRGLTAAAAAGAVLAAVLLILCARGRPFGSITDEAFHVRLALALARHGAFALPGPFGGPVTDPLPGFALLLALPAALLAPRWDLLWPLGAAASLAAAFLAWRLARALLPEGAAAAAGLLAAFSPALAAQSGAAMPDALYAAVCAAAFLFIASGRRGRRAFAALAALGGLAAILRPDGFLLLAAAALGWGARRGRREGLALAGWGALPLLAVLARNRLVAGSATVYAPRAAAQAFAALGSLPERAWSVASVLLGKGAAGAAGWPGPAAALAGLLLLAAAARGTRALLRGGRRPAALALGLFAAGTLGVRLLWPFSSERYALPLLAPLWILAAAGLEGLGPAPRAGGLVLAAALGLSALRADAELARDRARPRPPARAALSAWVRARLPPDARLESFACQPLALLSDRAVECPAGRFPREAWISGLLGDGVGWVQEDAGWRPDGYFPPGLRRFAAERARWLEDGRDFERVYAGPDGAVYRLRPRDAARYRAAWTAFAAASADLGRGDVRALRADLDEAVRLNPRFSAALAMRALLEKDPARAAARMRLAARADPGDPRIRAELARLERAAGARDTNRARPASN
jgi:hypothetical protein